MSFPLIGDLFRIPLSKVGYGIVFEKDCGQACPGGQVAMTEITTMMSIYL